MEPDVRCRHCGRNLFDAGGCPQCEGIILDRAADAPPIDQTRPPPASRSPAGRGAVPPDDPIELIRKVWLDEYRNGTPERQDDAAAWLCDRIPQLCDRLARAEAERDAAVKSKTRTQEWYGERWGVLWQYVERHIPEALDDVCGIIANASTPPYSRGASGLDRAAACDAVKPRARLAADNARLREACDAAWNACGKANASASLPDATRELCRDARKLCAAALAAPATPDERTG